MLVDLLEWFPRLFGVPKRGSAFIGLLVFGCGGRSLRHEAREDSESGGTSSETGGSSTTGGASSVGGGSNVGGGTRTGGGPSTGGGNSTGGMPCADTQFDAANCGACGHVCKQTCELGRCVERLVEAQHNATCVAVSESHVYWGSADLDRHEGSLSRAPIGGGSATLVASGLSPLFPCSLVLDGSYAYFTSEFDALVLKVAREGGLALTVATPEGVPRAIAVDATSIYWAETDSSVRKMPREGGEVTTLASEGGALQAFTIDSEYAYWTTRDGQPLTGRVMRVPLSGGEPEVLAAEQGTSSGLVVDATQVYWTDRQGGSVHAVPREGGEAVTIAGGEALLEVMAADESTLYVGTALGHLLKIPKYGSQTLVIAYDAFVFDIAVDATSVYYTNGSDVIRVTPK